MNVFEAVVRLPFVIAEGYAISGLHVPGLAVELGIAADAGVGDITEFGDEFRVLFLPDDVGGLDPLAGGGGDNRVDFIAVNGGSEPKAVRMIGLGEDVEEPGAIVIDIAEIAASADDGAATVADAGVVVEV